VQNAMPSISDQEIKALTMLARLFFLDFATEFAADLEEFAVKYAESSSYQQQCQKRS